jgi:hypothetical protein
VTLTNAPAIVTQLSTQLAACASWPGGAVTNLWYPRVPWASATLPLAVLEETERTWTPYAAGAGGLVSGTLKATIHYAATSDEGTVEAIGRTLLGELLAQNPGIIFRTSDCGLSGTYTSAENATDTATIAIQLTLAYGLNA